MWTMNSCSKHATTTRSTNDTKAVSDAREKVVPRSSESAGTPQNYVLLYPQSRSTKKLPSNEITSVLAAKTLLMQRIANYGMYYDISLQKKLNLSNLKVPGSNVKGLYQIYVQKFTEWQYWPYDPVTHRRFPADNLEDIAVPAYLIFDLMKSRVDPEPTDFQASSKAFNDYYQLGFEYSGASKTAILATTKSDFPSKGDITMLLKFAGKKSVEMEDGFAIEVPVLVEQELDAEREKSMVEVWKIVRRSQLAPHTEN